MINYYYQIISLLRIGQSLPCLVFVLELVCIAEIEDKELVDTVVDCLDFAGSIGFLVIGDTQLRVELQHPIGLRFHRLLSRRQKGRKWQIQLKQSVLFLSISWSSKPLPIPKASAHTNIDLSFSIHMAICVGSRTGC